MARSQDTLTIPLFDGSAFVHKVAPVPAAVSTPPAKKALGAFYTPPAMAQRLVDWAIRAQSDRVLDPSFGGGVFLKGARARLEALGAEVDPACPQIFGAELEDLAFADASREWAQDARLWHRNFFDLVPGQQIPHCEAVVGNPPYVRYQDFNRSSEQAHRICADAGLKLTKLASSWAPFLVHATSFVAEGGRMAQVLPAELLHAQYAGGITDFLTARFARVSIAVFEQRVFPGALEEVVLLFADDRQDEKEGSVELVSFDSLASLRIDQLFTIKPSRSQKKTPRKLISQLLPRSTQDLYWGLSKAADTNRLGDLAAVEIGAVTGSNSFFLMAEEEAREMPASVLRPAVSKAAQIPGARFRSVDHKRLLEGGHKAKMFVASPSTEGVGSAAVRSYIAAGEEMGVADAYKCRIRESWWTVPLPKRGVADLLLTYFASEHPRLVANKAQVLQTNTIHGVYLKGKVSADALAVAFYNSLTLLSVELNGRSYGGGVLKLEPTEAGELLIPPIAEDLAQLLPQVDEFVRCRDIDGALSLVDPLVLGRGLGLSEEQIAELRSGAARLRSRRRSRGRLPRT